MRLSLVLRIFILSQFVIFPAVVCQIDEAPDDSTIIVTDTDTVGFTNVESTFKSLNIEKTGDIFDYYSSFYHINEGKPGGTSSLAYNGLNPKMLTIKFDDVRLKSFLFGTSDINNINYPAIAEVEMKSNLTLSVKPVTNENDAPYSRVIYNFGDYKRSYVNILFAKKLGKKSKIILNGTKSSFPGELADYNSNKVKLYGSYSYLLKDDITVKFDVLRNNRKYTAQSHFLNVIYDSSPIGVRRGNIFNVYNVGISQFTVKNISVAGNFYYFKNDKSSQTGSLQESTRDEEKIFGTSLAFQKKEKKYNIKGTIEISGYKIKGGSINKYNGLFIDSEIQFNRHFPFGSLLVSAGCGSDSDRGNVINLNTEFIRHFRKSHLIYGRVLKKSRLPSFSELYWTQDLYKGNDDLISETILSSELGIYLKFSDIGNMKSTIFARYMKNPIINMLVNQSYLKPENKESFNSYGCNFSFDSMFSDLIQSSVNFSIYESRGDNDCFYSPDYSLVSRLFINNPEDFYLKGRIDTQLIFTGILMGKRSLLGFYPLPEEYYFTGHYASRSFLMNFKAAATIRTVTLYFEIYNLLNSDFQKLSQASMPGLFRRWGIEWHFYN